MDIGVVKLIDIDRDARFLSRYAMSVIVAPLCRMHGMGLTLHRRILYAMHDMGLRPGTPYKRAHVSSVRSS